MQAEVRNLGELDAFAEAFLQAYPNGGVFGLSGELGVGKTTFVRAILKRLSGGHPGRVLSPSFTLHQSHATTPPVEHFDLYRLKNVTKDTLLEIGFWEAQERAAASHGYVFIEWPEVAGAKELGCLGLITVKIVGETRVYLVNAT